jgi:hypothetical protein
VVINKVVAILFVVLIVLPFTEPWPTCPLTRGQSQTPDDIVPASPQGGIGGQLLRSISPNTDASEVATPITHLPPLRASILRLRMRAASHLRAPGLYPDAMARLSIDGASHSRGHSSPPISPGPPRTLRL